MVRNRDFGPTIQCENTAPFGAFKVNHSGHPHFKVIGSGRLPSSQAGEW